MSQRKLACTAVSDDGAEVKATAAGSHGEAYQLTLNLRAAPPQCTCSCPVGKNEPDRLCKHGLALLLWRSERLETGELAEYLGLHSSLMLALLSADKQYPACTGGTLTTVSSPKPSATPTATPLPAQPKTTPQAGKRKLPGFLSMPPPQYVAEHNPPLRSFLLSRCQLAMLHLCVPARQEKQASQSL